MSYDTVSEQATALLIIEQIEEAWGKLSCDDRSKRDFSSFVVAWTQSTLVSHDKEQAGRIADYVWLIYDRHVPIAREDRTNDYKVALR